MNIQTRIILLLVGVTVLFLGGFIYLKQRENARIREIFAEREREDLSSFIKIIDLSGSQFKTTIFDYTYWDDLVKFVAKPDPKWAKVNLEDSFSNYKFAGFWVFDKNFKQVYSWKSEALDNFEDEFLEKNNLRAIFAKNYFDHFYTRAGKFAMEIRAAPIQPTADKERKTRPKGYFIAGMLLGQDYINQFSTVFPQSSVTIFTPSRRPSAESDAGVGIITLRQPLNDFRGHPIAEIRAEKHLDIFSRAYSSAKAELAFYILFALIVLGIMYYAIHKWVTYPVGVISEALRSSDSSVLERNVLEGAEFRHIAFLIDGFFKQQSQLSKMHHELRYSQEKLLQFSKHLLAAREDEKRKLSQYIHDELGAYQSALSSLLVMAEADVSGGDSKSAAENIAQARRFVKELIVLTKNVSSGLRPLALEVAGLKETVNEFVCKIRSASKHDIDFECDLDDEADISQDTRIVVYRIVQEALNNVTKHSQAKNVKIILSKQGGVLSLVIQDDGVGFDRHNLSKDGKTHFGLQSMQEYAAVVGASVGVVSAPGRGTYIKAEFRG